MCEIVKYKCYLKTDGPQYFSMQTYVNDYVILDLESMDENCRSLTLEQAVQIGLEMFGLLAARCVILFKEHLQSQELGVNFVPNIILDSFMP